jgi:hypothetical protein
VPFSFLNQKQEKGRWYPGIKGKSIQAQKKALEEEKKREK